jgi:hypothetical protein
VFVKKLLFRKWNIIWRQESCFEPIFGALVLTFGRECAEDGAFLALAGASGLVWFGLVWFGFTYFQIVTNI